MNRHSNVVCGPGGVVMVLLDYAYRTSFAYSKYAFHHCPSLDFLQRPFRLARLLVGRRSTLVGVHDRIIKRNVVLDIAQMRYYFLIISLRADQ